MTRTDLCANKPQSVLVIFEPPCITGLVEQLIVPQMVRKFNTFYGTQRLNYHVHMNHHVS